MKNKRLSIFAGILIATNILMVLYYLLREAPESEPSDTHVKMMPTMEMRPGPEIRPGTQFNPETARQVLKMNSLPETQVKLLEYQNSQAKLINNFKDTVKLEMDIPASMDYIPMDMDEEVAGIYGSTQTGDRQFAILATRGNVSTEEAVSYLNESQEAFPMLKNRKLLSEKALKIDAPPETGLKELTIIPTEKSGKKGVYAALAPREDGKGTYLFMMEAPAAYFDENEGGLELMLKSIRTRP